MTANQVPNLLYELVVGGALTGAMVPILARSAERSADPAEKARVSQVTSAALTWSLLVLVPLTIVVVVAAGPIAALLDPANPNSHCNHAQVVSTTSRCSSSSPLRSCCTGYQLRCSGCFRRTGASPDPRWRR